MDFIYERDDEHRRVVVAFRGPFQTSDALKIIERLHIERVWNYGALYDLRGMTGHPVNADLRKLLSEQTSASKGRRGPLAFVVTDPEAYYKACTYKALAESNFDIEVFRDRRDAELWLEAHTA